MSLGEARSATTEIIQFSRNATKEQLSHAEELQKAIDDFDLDKLAELLNKDYSLKKA
jgi:hypothetical protein